MHGNVIVYEHTSYFGLYRDPLNFFVKRRQHGGKPLSGMFQFLIFRFRVAMATYVVAVT